MREKPGGGDQRQAGRASVLRGRPSPSWATARCGALWTALFTISFPPFWGRILRGQDYSGALRRRGQGPGSGPQSPGADTAQKQCWKAPACSGKLGGLHRAGPGKMRNLHRRGRQRWRQRQNRARPHVSGYLCPFGAKSSTWKKSASTGRFPTTKSKAMITAFGCGYGDVNSIWKSCVITASSV